MFKTTGKSTVFAIATILGAGCASHSALKEYDSAREHLEAARKANPLSQETADAEYAYLEGKHQMESDENDQAVHMFRLSMRSAIDAIQKSKEGKRDLPPPPAVEISKEAKVATESKTSGPQILQNETGASLEDKQKQAEASKAGLQELKNSAAEEKEDKMIAEKTSEKMDKQGLPARALQKYLAQKRGVEVPPPADAKTVMKSAAAPKLKAAKTSTIPMKAGKAPQPVMPNQTAAAKTENAEVAPKEAPAPELQVPVDAATPTSAGALKDSGGKTNETEKPVETDDPRGAIKSTKSKTVVNATTKSKNIEVAPGGEAPAKPAQEKVIAEPAPKIPDLTSAPANPKIANKKRIPGTITFFLNDPSIQPDMMPTLDQTSKYLLDNPSISLVMEGQIGPTEANTMIDARYESIRSYLVGKGVPEDQIQLDPERKRSKSPDFLFFEVQH